MKLKQILEEYNASPVAHRPLKLVHGFEYAEDAPIAEKIQIIRDKLVELADLGYGGVVTNVNAYHHYLESAEEWQLLRFTFQTCRKLGLRTWIYDEQGYPSGGAGGITLRDHPECEAKALAMLVQTFEPGEEIRLALPHGHSFVYAAAAWQASSLDDLTDEDVLHPWKTYPAGDIVDRNDSGKPVTAAIFCVKPMYEGGHTVHNAFESRRYIDVSDHSAIEAFVQNTYMPYFAALKDDGPIEGFFTDEPSYMAAYINLRMYPRLRDPFDETIPLLPVVNWGRDMANRFHARCGYDLKDRVVYLFCGQTELARKIRLDFYETTSALYEEAFFAQLGDVCGRNGTSFSGHILLEDDIRYHPFYEGNYFSLLRHMHIPGIDMLNGLPEKQRKDAFTPKLVSSVAHTYGRPHVMSEISAHMQGGKITPQQLYGTMMTQYALGVDIFHSYFSEHLVDAETYRAFHQAVGRTDAIIGGGSHITGIAVYYPIDTVQAGTIPHGKEIYQELSWNADTTACWNSVRDVQDELLSHQLDFDYLDAEALERSTLTADGFFSPGGEQFRVLVLPACRMTERLRAIVSRLTRAGIPVLRLTHPILGEEKDTGAEILSGTETLAKAVRSRMDPFLTLENAPSVVALCRENQNGRSILVVNTEDVALSVDATAILPEGNACLYDPLKDETLPIQDATSFRLDLDAYGAVLLLTR